MGGGGDHKAGQGLRPQLNHFQTDTTRGSPGLRGKKGMTNDETRGMDRGVPNLCKLLVGPRHPGNRLTTLLLRRR